MPESKMREQLILHIEFCMCYTFNNIYMMVYMYIYTYIYIFVYIDTCIYIFS